jgi:ribonuclease T2
MRGELIMRSLTTGLVLFTALLLPALAQKRDAPPSTPGKFDYYLLSLSWSPQYCLEMGDDPSDPQCGVGRHLGFVVHGLWPENQTGLNPRVCHPAPALDSQTAKSALDIMPSQQLIAHEWGEHGTCSGLPPAEFFKQTRTAWQKVKIPAKYQAPKTALVVPVKEFQQALIEANPGLKAENFALYCDNRFLREVRVCMDRNLNFRACGERVHDACGLAKMVLQPVR